MTDEKLIPRHGERFAAGSGSGSVTSGGYSPVLGKAIAMGYVTPWAGPDDSVQLSVRGRAVTGRVVKPPFVKGKK